MEKEIELAAGQRELFLTSLYKTTFPKVAKYISRRGGSFEETKDVFQDSVVIYYEKMVLGQIELNNNQGYLMGIAKHVWLRKFAGNIEEPLDDALVGSIAEPETTSASTNKLLHYLSTAGEKCMNLLKAFYYDRMPVEEIKNAFGYSGVRSATVQKYKCLEKVRNTVKEKSLHYEDFIE